MSQRPAWFRLLSRPAEAPVRPPLPAPTPLPPTAPPSPPPLTATPNPTPATPLTPPGLSATASSSSPVVNPTPPPSPVRTAPNTPSPPRPSPLNSPARTPPHSAPPPPAALQPLPTPPNSPVITPKSTPPTAAPPIARLSPPPKTFENGSEGQSPKPNKPLSHPPSPLTLPPPQIEADGRNDYESGKRGPKIDLKNVLVQETINKLPTKSHHSNHPHTNGLASKGKREPITNGRNHKNTSESEELGVRSITLAGENKGAIMELGPSPKRNSNLAKYADSSEGQGSGSGHGGDGKSKNKEKNNKNCGVELRTGFFNSNVQGINNSILYNTKCGHNDPGIHLSLTRKPNGDHKRRG